MLGYIEGDSALDSLVDALEDDSPTVRIHAMRALERAGTTTGSHLNDAFGDVGSGGGHHDVAGGEIPLGIFADYTSDDTQLLEIVDQLITVRLVSELNLSEKTED